MAEPGMLVLKVSTDAVGIALDRLAEHLDLLGITVDRASTVMLVADEILSNVARCGWPSVSMHEFTFSVIPEVVDRQAYLRLRCLDDGIAFDPTTVTSPNLGLSLDDRPVGSLGLHLVRSFSREMSYVRLNGQNRLDVLIEC